MDREARMLLIAKVLAPAGVNVNIQTIDLILRAIDLVDSKGEHTKISDIDNVIKAVAEDYMPTVDEDGDDDNK